MKTKCESARFQTPTVLNVVPYWSYVEAAENSCGNNYRLQYHLPAMLIQNTLYQRFLPKDVGQRSFVKHLLIVILRRRNNKKCLFIKRSG